MIFEYTVLFQLPTNYLYIEDLLEAINNVKPNNLVGWIVLIK